MTRALLAAFALALLAACGGEPEVSDLETEVDLEIADPVGTSVWTVDREASSIGFRATQNGKTFEGTFGRWNAAILLDLEAPEVEGSIEALIDLASADAGSKDRNEALPEEAWFNTALHPVAVFRSTAIRSTGPGTYEADGTLTIKGITREVVMPFSLEVDENGRAIADGSVILDRSEFGVGTGEFADGKWVGLEVEVLLHIEAVPAG
ncbi:YceI family protein [Parvularcula lutaonensis]|uniref:YceI family protein n=1 Tax=Parvularcula lutaonensis TaxID=491923 RepID=A0ABV7MC17_9PROT|nr:YceI family protein [Parvularcula lutaonensis]GGY49760.1 hypothetical protein GCM10007148_17990 [Parvularcula lutaonensis]